MKITASRYDELNRAREEYDAETQQLADTIRDQEKQYHKKQYEERQDVEKKVADLIGPTPLELQIQADPYGRYGSDTWKISVRANQNTKFNDNVALAWEWEISTDRDGNIVKDSGSWSGLKVTTPEQIADLEESVRIIKLLNSANWDDILNSPRAEYSDYIDHDVSSKMYDRKKNRPAFEKDMLDARLEDLIGKNVAVKLNGDEYFSGDVGIVLTGMTDKFLKGYVFPWRATKYGEPLTMEKVQQYAYNDARRVGKNKVVTENGLPVEVEIAE